MARDHQENRSMNTQNRAHETRAAHGPTVAPGYNDRKFGEDATEEDIRKGNVTRVTRVYLDENDPS